MIPFIRSLTELMAITESRDKIIGTSIEEKTISSIADCGQNKKYIKSMSEKEIDLPNLPKTKRRKWINSKEAVSKFFDGLDYNNQIQSSFDLTLIARQNKSNHQDAA